MTKLITFSSKVIPRKTLESSETYIPLQQRGFLIVSRQTYVGNEEINLDRFKNKLLSWLNILNRR